MGGIILGIAIGMAIGVGAYTFVYARGYSYMTDNAEACVNCHVMQEQFSGWFKLEPSFGGGLQRLPYDGRARRQIRH